MQHKHFKEKGSAEVEMQKKWNLMIVPNSPGRKVHSFNLSLRPFKIAAIVAAFLFVLSAAAALYAGHNYHQKNQTQISELELQIKARDAKLSELNRQFVVLEELEEKLRTVADLKPRKRSKIEMAAGGQGGPEGGDSLTNDPALFASADAVTMYAVESSAEELLENSIDLKDSFLEILQALERKDETRTRIPSLNPVASPGAWLSSSFGYRDDPISGKKRFHEGVDIVAPRGTPIIAPADGVVIYAGWDNGLGRMVVIAHGYGYSTAYGHCDALLVRRGERVKRGDVVAYIGSTGRSTGPHLHYEVRRYGKLDNPRKYLVD
ncbi:MAG: peptidoglycan DD-metalloendopeptidase family protein [Candidatus Lindowbacteria bacterium]|nr:peptidoglycan DD-metalloendopeptidase family protein [Candidatus Lindowbacteria bacterium]